MEIATFRKNHYNDRKYRRQALTKPILIPDWKDMQAPKHIDPGTPNEGSTIALTWAASQLNVALRELASRLSPFPSFMRMASIQAIEVEVAGAEYLDSGCVVVCADGAFYELSIESIPGPSAEMPVDQVETFNILDMSPQDYIQYACEAIRVIARQLSVNHSQSPG